MSRQFFRIDGADQETGQDTYLVLQADTKPQAERLARQQGLLISSIRVARPEDWSPDHAQDDAAPDGPGASEVGVDGVSVLAAVAASAVVNAEPRDVSTGELTPSSTDAPQPTPARPGADGPNRSAAIILACAAGALVIGGVLALTLALLPEHIVRNELQQLDFRLHELTQTVFGAMLVLSGMIVFLAATLFYLLPRSTPRQ